MVQEGFLPTPLAVRKDLFSCELLALQRICIGMYVYECVSCQHLKLGSGPSMMKVCVRVYSFISFTSILNFYCPTGVCELNEGNPFLKEQYKNIYI